MVDDVGISYVKVLRLSKLSVLDSLLSEGELEHLDSLEQIVVDVLLSLQLSCQLVDSCGHLLLFEHEFSLPLIVLSLSVPQEVHDPAH